MSMHWGWWLLWGILFLGLAWMAFGTGGRWGEGSFGPGSMESVEEMLRRRFARGEIDEEEFRRRMKLIKDSRDAT